MGSGGRKSGGMPPLLAVGTQRSEVPDQPRLPGKRAAGYVQFFLHVAG